MFGWLKQPTTSQEAEFIRTITDKNPLTPDIWTLEQYHFQKLFVYGTNMRGHPQHELAIEYGAYGACAYTDEHFTAWKKRLGKESFPIALKGSGWRKPDWARPPMARVQGELYIIETQQLIKLDKHFQNTLEFQRKRVPVIIPYYDLYRISDNSLYPHSIKTKINESLGIDEQVVTTERSAKVIKAWMYIGKSEFWDDQLAHYFQPLPVYQSRIGWLGDYYAFNKDEYDK